MSNTLNITEYNLLDYSLKLQEAVEKGYRVSDSVDGSPIMVGFVYTATLMKREAEVVDELTVKVKIDTTELQEQLKQGGDIESLNSGTHAPFSLRTVVLVAAILEELAGGFEKYLCGRHYSPSDA